MMRTAWYCRAAVVMACFGIVLPTVRAEQTAAAPLVHDLALGEGGTLSGQVVSGEGLAQANGQVTVWQNGQQIASTKADANGNFTISGLRGGVHQVTSGEGAGVYRFWTNNTAPPSAGKQLMVVADGNVVRGRAGGAFVAFITNPWVLAGIVATAIAVPIALNNDDDSGS